ncbi:MAG TPA: hypothetical protein PLK99_02050, partial [Burkholderiales bacterium]|nr:hypothetical protein [Burkholderiales bacterium]
MKLILIISALALALTGCDHRPSQAPKTAVHQRVSRADFTKFVMGKSNVPIEAKFGKPYLNNDYAEQ